MRRYALAALAAAVLCCWSYGVHENDTWKGIKMYKRVTKTDRSHPAHKMFGKHGDICEVEYTDEFKRYMQQAPEFNASQHRQGAPSPNLSDQGGQYASAAAGTWINPVLVGRTAGIAIELDTAGKKTIVTFPADGSNTMWWLLAQCTGPASRAFAAQNTYMDEHIHWVSADGQTVTNLTVNDVLLDKATGCGGGYMEQILADDPSLKGTWEFKMMYLHTVAGDNPEGETSSKWVPVHDYRNELYDFVVVVP